MDEMRYTISDAAKMVKVESHVLRYWEDELALEIPRNEMGHRYYTQREIDIFCQIRALKDRGLQLKAIKDVLEIMSGQKLFHWITFGRIMRMMKKRVRKRWKKKKIKRVYL